MNAIATRAIHPTADSTRATLTRLYDDAVALYVATGRDPERSRALRDLAAVVRSAAAELGAHPRACRLAVVDPTTGATREEPAR